MDDTINSHFGRSLRDNSNGFVVLLEKVPEGSVLQEYRERESSWISRIDTLHLVYNSRRQIAKPPDPLVSTHGHGPAPVKRSRHPDRMKNPNLEARYLTKEGIRRTLHFENLMQNRPDEVETYISSLHCRAIQRILKYMSSIRRGDSLKDIFGILRQRYLSEFPVPKTPPPPSSISLATRVNLLILYR